jgi:hypothetical protein
VAALLMFPPAPLAAAQAQQPPAGQPPADPPRPAAPPSDATPAPPSDAAKPAPEQADPPPQPATQVPPGPVAAPPPVGRVFTAPAGALFNTVRPERVKDFETFLSHLRFALDKSTNPDVREQAKSWQIYRATEPGPNNTVLNVFLFDPAVKGADYSLGRILADAYADTVQLAEVWKLYTSSITGGGSLLNLTPVMPVQPPPEPGAPVR